MRYTIFEDDIPVLEQNLHEHLNYFLTCILGHHIAVFPNSSPASVFATFLRRYFPLFFLKIARISATFTTNLLDVRFIILHLHQFFFSYLKAFNFKFSFQLALIAPINLRAPLPFDSNCAVPWSLLCIYKNGLI